MRTALLASALFFAVIAASASSCGSSGSDGGSGGSSGTGGSGSPSGSGGSSAGGTGGSSGTGGASAATFAQVQAIFSDYCALCHSGASETSLPAAQDLTDGKAYASIVDVDSIECAGMGGRKRVKPGDPDNSYLLDKLKGQDLCSGGRMPPGVPLPDDKLATIESWIRGGAKP